MGNEREEHHFIMAQNKPLSQVKADLVHALLSVCLKMCQSQLISQGQSASWPPVSFVHF